MQGPAGPCDTPLLHNGGGAPEAVGAVRHGILLRLFLSGPSRPHPRVGHYCHVYTHIAVPWALPLRSCRHKSLAAAGDAWQTWARHIFCFY